MIRQASRLRRARLRSYFTGLLLLACSGLSHGNPLILFNQDSEQDSGTPAILALPMGSRVTITSITNRCKAARHGVVRIYDLESGECTLMPSIGPGAFHQPSLDLALQGGILVGEPVRAALDAGLYVWYDLHTSRACVVGSCNTTFVSQAPPPPPPTNSVRINSFTANPGSITAGNETTLSWSTSYATSCTLGDDQGGGTVSVSISGSVLRTPLVTTTFKLTCQGNNGPVARAVLVTVNESPPEDIFSDGFESQILQ